MKDEKCQTCQYFVPDSEKPRCAVPIWGGAELFRIHYTAPEKWCALYEKAEMPDETPKN